MTEQPFSSPTSAGFIFVGNCILAPVRYILSDVEFIKRSTVSFKLVDQLWQF